MTAPTTLRGDEYDVLGHFAEGHDAGVIANMLGLDLARVQGILTRKCQMKRAKARELVNGGAAIDTDGRERAALSPLTAPILPVGDVAAPKPEPVPMVAGDPVSQTLDEGIQAVADKLRALVASLVDTALDQQRKAHLRRLDAIKAELDAARAELDGAP